jgi:hypothetical protein
MSKFFNSGSKNDQNSNSQDNDRVVSPKKEPHLKLVVSNPAPVEEKPFSPFILARPMEGFSATVKTVCIKDSPLILYEMMAKDPSHYLECELALEVEEGLDDDEEGKVICHFPPIDDALLNKLVMEDETLYSFILIQFQMKVMEQLLLFCSDQCASQLTIYMDDDQAEKFGIYESFLVRQDKIVTVNGEQQTEMVMPADQETFDVWVDFMDQTRQNFQQTLWKDKKINPVIPFYLKSDPQLRFF